MQQMNVIEWTDLLFFAEKQGFEWNYAHELLRAFQNYEGAMTINCQEINEIEPMDDPYVNHFKEKYFKDGDLNQMGRDIVYMFMQKHGINEMLVIQS